MKRKILLFTFLFCVSNFSFSQTIFEKITNGVIVNDNRYGSGCAWGDYNNDGRLDMIVTSYNDFGSSGFPLLYLNQGNDNFISVTNNGIVNNSLEQTLACAWGDYNHDSRLDLFISVGYNQNNLLYKNLGAGNFQRIMTGPIVNTPGHSGGCCWTDYNKDGFLDLLVVQHGYNLLYRGNIDGSFTQITTGPIVTDNGTHRRAAWGDYNNDLFPDLYVTNYENQNDNLYLNNRNGTFTKITSGEIVNSGGWGSGCSWGDYNNDGWLDLYVTNENAKNFLYKNNHDGTFTKITNGSIVNDVYASFGCNWGDYDNDGDLDLFVANTYNQPDNLYRNDGGDNFTKISNEVVVNDSASGEGASWGDYNNDGKLDLFVVNQGYYGNPPENDFLYKNIGAGPYYLIVRLLGGGVGTRITLVFPNRILIREVSGGNSCGSQDMLWQHFGLGFLSTSSYSVIDSVIVDWNDGYREVATNLQPNQTIEFSGTVGINPISNLVPKDYDLMQNYPNPFNPSTTIGYSIIKPTNVELSVYDVTGRYISTIVNTFQTAGSYQINFDGINLSSGIYIYKLETNEFTDAKKMIFVK